MIDVGIIFRRFALLLALAGGAAVAPPAHAGSEAAKVGVEKYGEQPIRRFALDVIDQLDKPETKSWVLYRIGLCQQRLGRFADADKTFAAVQQGYPNSVPAQRAAERQGARSFYVQVGTFSSPAGADKTVAALRAQGTMPEKTVDAKGRHIVRVGPLASFQQAQSVKQRLAGSYPDAMIIP